MLAGMLSAHGELQQAGSEVVMLKLHPPLIVPVSPPRSSTTYRLQVPLGFRPLNTESCCGSGYGPAGAGAGKGSEVPLFVGLNVPETMVPGMASPASSNVRLALTA